MSTQHKGLPSRTYFYVQAADQKTENLFHKALPEKTAKRLAKEGVFPYDMYRVSWNDIECFLKYSYLTFNVYSRKENDECLRLRMKKNSEIEKRNTKISSGYVPLSLVPFRKLPVESLVNREKPKLILVPKKIPKTTYLPYLVYPHPDCVTIEFTVMCIREILCQNNLSPLSFRQSGKNISPEFDFLFEFNGDALFELWRLSRKNDTIQFVGARFPENGDFNNVEIVAIGSNEIKKSSDFTLLHYLPKNKQRSSK